MAIYTGNDGTMYLAPRSGTGLVGVITATLNAPVLTAPGLPIFIGQVFQVVTRQGSGRGAQARALTNVPAGSPQGTACQFEVIAGGTGYAAGNKIDFVRAGQEEINIFSDVNVTVNNTVFLENIIDLTEPVFRVGKIRGWTLNSNSEVIETTSLGDTTKTYAPSVTSNDGTATLLFYEQDTGAEQAGDIYNYIDILFPVATPREVRMNLLISRGTFTQSDTDFFRTNFSFNAFITSASIGVSYGEVVTVETNFTVNGPLGDRPFNGGQIY